MLTNILPLILMISKLRTTLPPDQFGSGTAKHSSSKETRIQVSDLEEMMVRMGRMSSESVRGVMNSVKNELLKEIEIRTDDTIGEVARLRNDFKDVQRNVIKILDILLGWRGTSDFGGFSGAAGHSAGVGPAAAGAPPGMSDPSSTARAWRILNSIPTSCRKCHFCSSGKKCPSGLIKVLLMDITDGVPYTNLSALVPNSPTHYLLTEIFNQIGTPTCRSNCNVCFTISNNEVIKRFLADLAPRILNEGVGGVYGAPGMNPMGMNPMGYGMMGPSGAPGAGMYAPMMNPMAYNPFMFNTGAEPPHPGLVEMLAVHNYSRGGAMPGCTGSGGSGSDCKGGAQHRMSKGNDSEYTTFIKRDEKKDCSSKGVSYDSTCN